MNSDLIAAILAYFKVTEWSGSTVDLQFQQAHRVCPDCGEREYSSHDFQCPRAGLIQVLEGLLNESKGGST